jgi:hypothetical protein
MILSLSALLLRDLFSKRMYFTDDRYSHIPTINLEKKTKCFDKRNDAMQRAWP